MSRAFNAPARRRRPSINITSLIDVMFLLLIFFMVSSTFKSDLGLDISLPQAEGVSQQDVTTHEILVDKSGVLYFDGESVSPDRLREGLSRLLENQPKAGLVLRADKAAEFGSVVRAIDIARDVGGERLVIPTDLLEEAER